VIAAAAQGSADGARGGGAGQRRRDMLTARDGEGLLTADCVRERRRRRLRETERKRRRVRERSGKPFPTL
jgi:hypothetical protein